MRPYRISAPTSRVTRSTPRQARRSCVNVGSFTKADAAKAQKAIAEVLPRSDARHRKSFPVSARSNNVSPDPQRWRSLALVGENGAGKSTLMKVLAVRQADEGEVFIDGAPFYTSSRAAGRSASA